MPPQNKRKRSTKWRRESAITEPSKSNIFCYQKVFKKQQTKNNRKKKEKTIDNLSNKNN